MKQESLYKQLVKKLKRQIIIKQQRVIINQQIEGGVNCFILRRFDGLDNLDNHRDWHYMSTRVYHI